MRHIDEVRLASDAEYRFHYLAEFIGFGPHDIDALQSAAPALSPLVPTLVDAVYDKLFAYDSTKRHFMVRNAGYQGEIPPSLEELTPNHDLIRFRKGHLARYIEALVTRPYNEKMVAYLDMVGRIHTAGAGNRDIHVPLIQMNALLGFVSDALIGAVEGLDVPIDYQRTLIRAINKILWIQGDFIARHYVADKIPATERR